MIKRFFLALLLGSILFKVMGANKTPPTVEFTGGFPMTLCILLGLEPEQPGPHDGPIDAIYIVPSQAQIDRMNKAVFKKEKYVPNAHDCDDFAFEYMVAARRWSAKTFPKEEASVAVGVLCVEVTGPVPDLGWTRVPGRLLHALNVVLRDDGTWIVIEPQNGKQALWQSLYYEGNVKILKVII